jgi:hypothetical protein
MHKSLSLFFLIFVIGCNSEPPAESQNKSVAPIPNIEASDDKSDIDKAKKMLGAEASIVDFNYDATNAVQWTIAVKNDGSKRYGFAKYICMNLPKNSDGNNHYSVRIVDAAKRLEHGDDYRSYSLGAVRCSDGGYLD